VVRPELLRRQVHQQVKFTNNLIFSNTKDGIFYEISKTGIIASNVAQHSSKQDSSGVQQQGIHGEHLPGHVCLVHRQMMLTSTNAAGFGTKGVCDPTETPD
jgi:parallel beta-helix repeat protein